MNNYQSLHDAILGHPQIFRSVLAAAREYDRSLFALSPNAALGDIILSYASETSPNSVRILDFKPGPRTVQLSYRKSGINGYDSRTQSFQLDWSGKLTPTNGSYEDVESTDESSVRKTAHRKLDIAPILREIASKLEADPANYSNVVHGKEHAKKFIESIRDVITNEESIAGEDGLVVFLPIHAEEFLQMIKAQAKNQGVYLARKNDTAYRTRHNTVLSFRH